MRRTSPATRRSGDKPHCSSTACDSSSNKPAPPSQAHKVRAKAETSRRKPALSSSPRNAGYCSSDSPEGWIIDFNEICPDDQWIIQFWWKKMWEDPIYRRRLQDRWIELRAGPLSDTHVFQLLDSLSPNRPAGSGAQFSTLADPQHLGLAQCFLLRDRTTTTLIFSTIGWYNGWNGWIVPPKHSI